MVKRNNLCRSVEPEEGDMTHTAENRTFFTREQGDLLWKRYLQETKREKRELRPWWKRAVVKLVHICRHRGLS